MGGTRLVADGGYYYCIAGSVYRSGHDRARRTRDGAEAAPPVPLLPLPRRTAAPRRVAVVVAGDGGEEAADGRVRPLRAGAAVAGHRLPPDQPLLQLQRLLPVKPSELVHNPWAVAAVQLRRVAFLLQTNHSVQHEQDRDAEADTGEVLAVPVLRRLVHLLRRKGPVLGPRVGDAWDVRLPRDTGRVRLLLHGALPLQQIQRHESPEESAHLPPERAEVRGGAHRGRHRPRLREAAAPRLQERLRAGAQALLPQGLPAPGLRVGGRGGVVVEQQQEELLPSLRHPPVLQKVRDGEHHGGRRAEQPSGQPAPCAPAELANSQPRTPSACACVMLYTVPISLTTAEPLGCARRDADARRRRRGTVGSWLFRHSSAHSFVLYKVRTFELSNYSTHEE